MPFELKEECGVFGIWTDGSGPPVAQTTFYGLYALQHRGQESAGIAVFDPARGGGGEGGRIDYHRGMGLVSQVFTLPVLEKLTGSVAIGHVRYATHGESCLENAQPVVGRTGNNGLAMAHNGNLVNADALSRRLKADGAIFSSTSDTETILHLVARSRQARTEDRIREALEQVAGAYSLVILEGGRLFGVRDPRGFRPLVIGRLPGGWALASESCALDLIGATLEREVAPGEVVRVDEAGLTSQMILAPSPAHDTPSPSPCVFEQVYFARPDSIVFGRLAHDARFRMGQALARESRTPADIVVPVPDSGVSAALGYADVSSIPYTVGLTRNHYIGRTFIQPGQDAREIKLRVKLNPLPGALRGRRVILVDDSIVRGTTSRRLVDMLRAAGPAEIHLKVSSPPIRHPCFFGIDTPSYDELIGANLEPDEIGRYLGVDSLQYLSMDGLMDAVGGGSWCRACFGGGYPMEVPAHAALSEGAAARRAAARERLLGSGGAA